MKISARNQLDGTIAKIVTGPVAAEVTVKLSGGDTVVSVITAASAKTMKLKKGMPVCAIIKASDVMLAACEGGASCTCGRGC